MTGSSDSKRHTKPHVLDEAWYASLPDSLQQSLQSIPASNNYYVALSGGLDSSLLLLLASRYLSQFRQSPVTAIHVHHGLSDYADQWQAHCEQMCQRWGVALVVRKVSLTNKTKGVEEAARAARYTVFEDVLPNGAVLLQGHHQNDQAETVLLRLMRGAGAKGIASIPRTREFNSAIIERPFLALPRKILLQVATAFELEWVEDESNASLDYDRNYIRHEIIPQLENRWQGAISRLAMSASHCRESAELEDALAQIDLASIKHDVFDLALSITELMTLPMSRQRNVVRYWLRQKGVGYPGEKRFQRIWTELLIARDDANPLIEWSLGCVRRYRNAIFALSVREIEDQKAASHDVIKIGVEPSLYGDDQGVGRLSLFERTILGKCYTLCVMDGESKEGDRLLLRRPKRGEQVSIQFRQGGELFKPVGKAHHRPLKKWFHDENVPPWLRDSIPLLYYNESLVAVGNLLVAEGFQGIMRPESIEIKWG
ncbi:tRNA lysidine(34) synthetase TilS [Alkalimarinus alittae]|uniref:tRNA(Ile)-lysidine synthase n=1 Tax=Alkalimarinus alittae TaxID=2961619 RepID=A0ABY6N5V0_9ALTE|nr:tRNA lysidine(34) synthetase TilS [Alkalimarinus alittae]UZE97357.1 tRNA lysidine(34) synthetase TilS [Alkalimarinus alittae]